MNRRFADRFLTAVLFIDVVGSTNRATELGDRDWTKLLRKHEVLVKTQISRWDGREVDSSGDGSFAIFDLPAKAIGCAWTISRQAPKLGIEIKAGVHVGECERQDDRVRGLAVHVGARIASKAGPGETLISKTARDLIQGSGIRLRDKGYHEFKGAPGKWRLFVVEGIDKEAMLEGKTDVESISVMLVDDHPLWRETISRVLGHVDFLTLVGEASDGEEAVEVARQRRPDVILMDVLLPGMSGIEATRRICAELPDLKVLVLSSTDDKKLVNDAIAAGASGYLLKTAGADEIADAVRRASAGELVFPAPLSNVVLAELRRKSGRP
jgi:class 3 adenylate cyclase/CheY-like chemotaxis protein